MTQARILKSTAGAVVLPSCAPLMAQATDRAGAPPLDELLKTSISTAAKHEQRVTDVPVSITVITAEEIAGSGWHTLAAALRLHVGGW